MCHFCWRALLNLVCHYTSQHQQVAPIQDGLQWWPPLWTPSSDTYHSTALIQRNAINFLCHTTYRVAIKHKRLVLLESLQCQEKPSLGSLDMMDRYLSSPAGPSPTIVWQQLFPLFSKFDPASLNLAYNVAFMNWINSSFWNIYKMVHIDGYSKHYNCRNTDNFSKWWLICKKKL